MNIMRATVRSCYIWYVCVDASMLVVERRAKRQQAQRLPHHGACHERPGYMAFNDP